MNFSLYLLGNPDGYNQCPPDYSDKFRNVLTSCKTESQIAVFRDEHLVQYVYVRKVPGNEKLFLGFALVFTGVYCNNCHALNELFDRAFYDVLLKGELLRFQKDKYKYLVSRFAEKQVEVNRIYAFFKSEMDGKLSKHFVHTPSSFFMAVGETVLSIKDPVSDINDAVVEYNTVYLTNTEKTVSELERTQQMLSAIYEEHAQLKDNYNKVLNQKRNFKLVIVLSLIIIGCGAGFWLLKNMLNSKNNEIIEMGGDIQALNDTIKVKTKKNHSLTKEKQLLNDSILSLTNIIFVKDETIGHLQKNIDYLQNETTNLQKTRTQLQDQIVELKHENKLTTRQLNDSCRTIRRLRTKLKESNNSIHSERYKVWSSSGNKATIYYRRGNRYDETSWTINDNAEIYVYLIQDDYAVTSVGYLRVKDIKKL